MKISDISVSYSESGKGKPLVILHGWGGNKSSWKNVEQGLSKQGYCAIVPDLPGFGESDYPPKAWEVREYAEFVSEFLTALGHKKVILLGHSFGGRVSIKFSALFPERVEKLILIASAGIKHPPSLKMKLLRASAKFGRQLFGLLGLHRFPEVGYDDKIKGNNHSSPTNSTNRSNSTTNRSHRTNGSNSEDANPPVNSFEIIASKARGLMYRIAGTRDYLDAGKNRETFQKVIAEDLRPFLSKIRAQTLLLWGDRDQMTPIRDANIMEAEIPHARLVVFPGERHGLHHTVPEKIVSEVHYFLRS